VSERREEVSYLTGDATSGPAGRRYPAPGGDVLNGPRPHPSAGAGRSPERLGPEPSRKAELVSTESYEKLKIELQEEEPALAERAVEPVILQIKTNEGW
jgi:hypothetical protein